MGTLGFRKKTPSGCRTEVGDPGLKDLENNSPLEPVGNPKLVNIEREEFRGGLVKSELGIGRTG